MQDWVLQRYIANPLLVRGCKFHIRAHALVGWHLLIAACILMTAERRYIADCSILLVAACILMVAERQCTVQVCGYDAVYVHDDFISLVATEPFEVSDWRPSWVCYL